MKGSGLRPMSDFEWASVAQYVTYISGVAKLVEINLNQVNSFALARVGPDVFIKIKRRVLAALKANKKRLEIFVADHLEELNASEKSVLRTMYLQIRDCEQTVERHIRMAEWYGDISNDALLFEEADLGEESSGPF